MERADFINREIIESINRVGYSLVSESIVPHWRELAACDRKGKPIWENVTVAGVKLKRIYIPQDLAFRFEAIY